MEATTKEVLITYYFDAPRELVFETWTKREYLQRWYAPDNCTVRLGKTDFREGGSFHLCINNPQFGDCWCLGNYKEIKAPEKLVFTLAVADENGNRRSSIAAGMDPEWPDETLVTVTFTEEGGRTKMVLQQSVAEALAKRTGAQPSWIEMFGHQNTLLQSIQFKS